MAFLATALCVTVLGTGCAERPLEASPDLAALQEKLIVEYWHRDISVVQNSDVLGVSFVNSAFSELEESQKQRKAQEIAVFVTNHYAPIDKVDKIWVSFLIHEVLVFVYPYEEGRTYLFDKRSLINAGIQNKPAEEIVKARATYSEAQNKTTVLVNNLQLYGDLNKGLVLMLSFTVPGKKIVTPEWVDLEFASYEDRETFARNRHLSFLVDNKNMVSGETHLLSSGKTADGKVSEFLTHRIAYEEFLQIVDGREVTLKLGTKEIELTTEQLRLLREMKQCVDFSRCQ